jgi:hypothetical protein
MWRHAYSGRFSTLKKIHKVYHKITEKQSIVLALALHLGSGKLQKKKNWTVLWTVNFILNSLPFLQLVRDKTRSEEWAHRHRHRQQDKTKTYLQFEEKIYSQFSLVCWRIRDNLKSKFFFGFFKLVCWTNFDKFNNVQKRPYYLGLC